MTIFQNLSSISSHLHPLQVGNCDSNSRLVVESRIFFTFSPTSNHLHPLQVENCDSNSRVVVDEDDNGKFRLERVNSSPARSVYRAVYFEVGVTEFN